MPSQDSTRILRTAAWIWIGFLLAMAIMDLVLYTWVQPIPQSPLPLGAPMPPASQQLDPLNQQPAPLRAPRIPMMPVFLFYAANGTFALLFLIGTYWDLARQKLNRAFYPLLLLIISAAPILINVFVTPRFPPGPLANAEGMALRQLPVLFVALALVAYQYQLKQVVFYSIAVTTLELVLIYFSAIESRNMFVFTFIAIIRTISFIALGVFINLLVARLREQQQSLQAANANLTHYASTLEHLTVSRERNRLARELHDTLAHSLTAISVSLETAKAYFDIDPNKTRDLIEKSLESTRIGVDETRRALKSLRSNALEDLGLRLAIQRAGESAATRFHLNLELNLQDPLPSLSPDVEQTIYRITQEAIENITHHSRATKFSIQLTHNTHTTLTIHDDGMGFDMDGGMSSGHFGLVGMRERAELVGGKLKIESGRNKGTKIVLTI
jgi:signal transduction histidine kinase